MMRMHVEKDQPATEPWATRCTFLGAAAILVVMALTLGSTSKAFAGDDDDNEREPYAIGLWGDLPYNNIQKTVGVPNLIADMNSQELAFTAHDGDLKAGSGPCPDTLYTDALDRFNSLKAPAIFTPGDNDWTDCDRNAGVNSLERLDFERKI